MHRLQCKIPNHSNPEPSTSHIYQLSKPTSQATQAQNHHTHRTLTKRVAPATFWKSTLRSSTRKSCPTMAFFRLMLRPSGCVLQVSYDVASTCSGKIRKTQRVFQTAAGASRAFGQRALEPSVQKQRHATPSSPSYLPGNSLCTGF